MKKDSLLWWGGTLLFVIITFIPSIFIYPFLIWLMGDEQVFNMASVIALFLFIGFIVGFILRKNRQVKLIERIFRALFLASFFVFLYGVIRFDGSFRAHGNCIYNPYSNALYNKFGIKVKDNRGEDEFWRGYNEYGEPVFIYADEIESSIQITTDCYIDSKGERDYSRKVKVTEHNETYDISFYDSDGRFIGKKKSFTIYYESPSNSYYWEYYSPSYTIHDSNKWRFLGKEICDYMDYSLK